MGLWDFVKKMATGKPVFEVDSSRQQDDHAGWVEHVTTPEAEVSPYVDDKGNKIIPLMTIEHCKSHLDGQHLQVTAWLTNRSSFEVELDKIVMLDTKMELDRRLSPQQGHEVILYRGAVPTHDHAHKAQLYYKIVENGDYFCADFSIEYNLESDGRFTVEELHPERGMIHDV